MKSDKVRVHGIHVGKETATTSGEKTTCSLGCHHCHNRIETEVGHFGYTQDCWKLYGVAAAAGWKLVGNYWTCNQCLSVIPMEQLCQTTK